MKSNNALIITWIGEPASDGVVQAIAEVLVNNVTIPELLTIVKKDEDAIATALLKSSEESATVTSTDAKTSAIIYIGKRFESTLCSTGGDYIPFAMALLKAIADAKRQHTEEGVALVNAIKIVVEMDRMPKIANMYHITKGAIEVIKQVYHNTWIGA